MKQQPKKEAVLQDNNALQSFDTFCPLFPGFYGTHFEYDGEENDIDWYNEENGTNLEYDDFAWDYAEHNQRVCKAFVNRLEIELKHFLPIEITFEAIQSPKEYNFTNDSINVNIRLNLDALLSLIYDRRKDAAKYFADKYTSCSGFISFHSPFIGDWLNKAYIMGKPEHRIGALLDCLCDIEFTADEWGYWADDQNYIDFTPKN